MLLINYISLVIYTAIVPFASSCMCKYERYMYTHDASINILMKEVRLFWCDL